MITDEKLREKIRITRAIRQITYKSIARDIDMNYHSFINWLNGQYTFSENRKQTIIDYLERK